MKKFFFLLVSFLLVSTILFGQKKNEVLLTIDGAPVYVKEFKRVYNKNLDLVQDENQKTVDGYLDLFIDYKLKVTEAYAQKLDEKKVYKKELSEYQEQLSRYYIYEDNVTADLAKEAYDRGLKEIYANHILVLSKFTDSPADTLKAYQKIEKLRERALKGEDFETLTRENSEEPNAKQTAGDLGYFSVFSMVYPFETAAYNTKKGGISEIVRTQFGYHILKVNDIRIREPKRIVSHIMVFDKEDETRTFDPKERIEEIYQLLQQGEKFEDLAKQYSDDKGSATKGGSLRPFGKGELRSKLFETEIFNIKKEGDVTKPFKSEDGWHIARLDNILDQTSFEEEKEFLEKKVKDGARSKIVTAAVKNNIKEKYGFTLGDPYLEFFKSYVNDSLRNGQWIMKPMGSQGDKIIFTIGEKESKTYLDFAEYITATQKRRVKFNTIGEALLSYYDSFERDALKEYYRNDLEKKDEDYAAIINEYRDGLLIFDLMKDNIWNKAKNDTIGLQKYFDENRTTFSWEERVDAIIVNATRQAYADQARDMLQQGKNAEEIKKALNNGTNVKAIVTHGKFELSNKTLPSGFVKQEGVSKTYVNGTTFTVVNVMEILPPMQKSLDDVRGRVLSDYQVKVEEDWVKSLREKYNVTVNKKTLKKLKKEIDN
ncbi:peptidylprolyl isomerase [Rasiella sp. SM2506]|uniref:peptidylprolyl isomerase n=1 Tax=Rasiella sp. SM2506 TaxID=3423914 RepID=UPI003D7BFD40